MEDGEEIDLFDEDALDLDDPGDSEEDEVLTDEPDKEIHRAHLKLRKSDQKLKKHKIIVIKRIFLIINSLW